MGGHINSFKNVDSPLLTDKSNFARSGKTQLSIPSLNVCGLAAKLRCPDFVKFLCKYDIVGIQESNTDNTDTIHLNGYTCILKYRHKLSRYRSGGIALLVKNSISDYVNIETQSYSKLIVWCTISHKITCLQDDIIHCGVVYIPPQGSKYAHEERMLSWSRKF